MPVREFFPNSRVIVHFFPNMIVGVIAAISTDQKSIQRYSIKQCRRCISKFVFQSPEMAAPQPLLLYNLVKQHGTGTCSFWEMGNRWPEKYSEEGGVCKRYASSNNF